MMSHIIVTYITVISVISRSTVHKLKAKGYSISTFHISQISAMFICLLRVCYES